MNIYLFPLGVTNRGGPNIRIRIIIRIIRPEIIRQNIRIIRSNIRRILQFFFLKKSEHFRQKTSS